MIKSLQLYTHLDLKSHLNLRKGEKRMGQQVFLIEDGPEELEHLANKGAKFCIIGIPECIGPLGNGGKPGAQYGFESFLKYFLNIQSNRFLSGKELVLAGQVKTDDLMEQAMELKADSSYYLQKLHMLCETLDERVAEVISWIKSYGLIPIVIGGGHNNAFPIIQACANGQSMNVLNIDAHADFRALEGRHSGNGFSYAFEKGFLNKYAVFGLHQNYNSENMLKSMDSSDRISYSFLEDIQYIDKLFHKQVDHVNENNKEVGLEIDLDVIRMMPSSAISPAGFSVEQIRYFLRKVTDALKPTYLHLAEGAPTSEEDQIVVGKTLSYLVSDFVKGFG